MSAPTNGMLNSCIRSIITNWQSLQVAISNGMGGSDARLKEAWMIDVLESFLRKHGSSLYPDDVADYTSEILFNEFDTVIEDGSLEKVSNEICRVNEMCRRGEGEAALASLPQRTPNQVPRVRITTDTDEEDQEEMISGMGDMDLGDNENINEEAPQQQNGHPEEVEEERRHERRPQQQQEPDEDGWTRVDRRRR